MMHKWWPIFLRETSLVHQSQFEVLEALTSGLQTLDDETPFSVISYVNTALQKAQIPFQYREILQPGKFFIIVEQTHKQLDDKIFDRWCLGFESFTTARDNWKIEAGRKK